METLFEKAFVKALRKHSRIKKQVENKVRMIMEQPLAMGEPLKGNFRGFYSCPVKKSFIIYTCSNNHISKDIIINLFYSTPRSIVTSWNTGYNAILKNQNAFFDNFISRSIS